MANIKIKTKGMHCKSCEMLVKDALEDISGIEKVEASHESGIVSVDFDETQTNKQEIIKIIKQEGYKVE